MKKTTIYLTAEQEDILKERAKEKGISLNKYVVDILFPKDDKKEIENAILF